MMKQWIITAILLISITGISLAQSGQSDSGINIMATVVPSASVESIDIVVNISGQKSSGELDLSPFGEQGGLIVLSGTPYSEFTFNVPLETVLRNQYGDEAILTEYRFIAGENEDPDSMDMISPAECNEITIPESGVLYIRIGGKLESEENELRGIYTGTLSLECDTDR